MLDTVRLLISDFEVAKDSRLQIQPAPYFLYDGKPNPTGEFILFKDTTGELHRGSKAYLNTIFYNLSIRPYSNSKNGSSCLLNFSIPKVFNNGSNYNPVSLDETRNVFIFIENQLRKEGFYTSLRQADLSRVDTFINISTEKPFEYYFPVFALLNCRRAIQREYGTTYLLSNTQQEFCIYDKKKEMERAGLNTSNIPMNSMRFEHRLMSKQKISKSLGFTKVDELFSYGFNYMVSKKGKTWEENLFYIDTNDRKFYSLPPIDYVLRSYKSKYGKNFFGHLLKDYGAQILCERYGIRDTCISLKEIGENRMQINRVRKTMLTSEFSSDSSVIKNDSNEILKFLYQELKQKVCEE